MTRGVGDGKGARGQEAGERGGQGEQLDAGGQGGKGAREIIDNYQINYQLSIINYPLHPCTPAPLHPCTPVPPSPHLLVPPSPPRLRGWKNGKFHPEIKKGKKKWQYHPWGITMRLFWFSASPVFGGSTLGAKSLDNRGRLGSIAQLASV